ncbi:unnamed protein product, partial [Amoebophrya sp. A25]|eukprot:GSA25T00017758001.1
MRFFGSITLLSQSPSKASSITMKTGGGPPGMKTTLYTWLRWAWKAGVVKQEQKLGTSALPALPDSPNKVHPQPVLSNSLLDTLAGKEKDSEQVILALQAWNAEITGNSSTSSAAVDVKLRFAHRLRLVACAQQNIAQARQRRRLVDSTAGPEQTLNQILSLQGGGVEGEQGGHQRQGQQSQILRKALEIDVEVEKKDGEDDDDTNEGG